jgi:hypothetical protein
MQAPVNDDDSRDELKEMVIDRLGDLLSLYPDDERDELIEFVVDHAHEAAHESALITATP